MTATTTTPAGTFTATVTFVDNFSYCQSTRTYTGTYPRAMHWLEQARLNCADNLLTADLVATEVPAPAPNAKVLAVMADLRKEQDAKDLESMLARDWTQAETIPQWRERLARKLANGVRP